MSDIADAVASALTEVRERVENAAKVAGRDPADVTLIAVSKAQPLERLQAAIDAGQRVFGENYVQEFLGKRPDYDAPDIRWHYIGRLQTNKVRQIVGQVHRIHSVDRTKLAKEIAKRSVTAGITSDILVQVNVGEEESKGGISAADAERELGAILELPNLNLHGLMCIPPFLSPDEVRPYFVQLRELRDRLEPALGVKLPDLSMGMSGDYETAIAEGATLVRVGSAIFGARTYRQG
jgi:PLP dependent protein